MLKRYTDPAQRVRALERVRWLARFLDTAFQIPGTNQRVGFDGIIGLIPGGGDAVSAALATYVVYEAARLGARRRTILHMLGLVALDLLVGAIPVAGDLADFFFRVNRRNLELLERDLLEREKTHADQDENTSVRERADLARPTSRVRVANTAGAPAP